MSGESTIKVDSVYKDFKLPHQRKDSVKSIFTGVFDKSSKTKSFEVQHALKNIDFDVKPGEFFGIVGRNGSGKSTLLKILAGIYQPTKGSVQVNGRLVPFIELGVGFNPELTGRENVYLNGALLGFSRQSIDNMYDDIVEFAELERFMDQKLKNYSSGMQVRLAFSMAIRADADILLVDEVLAVGDADFQRKCFDYFRKLKKNKKTVVFVTHDMSAVVEYCDRAMLIDDSKIIEIASATKIAKMYTNLFIDEASGKQKEGDKRWGDGKIKYESVKVNSAKLTDKEKEIEIEAIAVANGPVESPVFGLLVKNGAGSHIMGTNTKLKTIKIEGKQKGEKYKITWKVPNVFNEGTHYIDPAITSDDGSVTHDWWEEAVSFDVFKTEKTPYIINPSIDVEIK